MSNEYYGKYEGIVEDNQDPLNMLRIKVRVPAVLGDKVSNWAFPCVPYGGRKDIGDFNPPEVDTKVWVEFKGGNPAYPIWTGFFWSQPGGESEVPDGVDDKHRLIQTSSGHKIEIVDEQDKEYIKMTTHSGHEIVFNDEPGKENVAITTQGGHKFDMRDETDTEDAEASSDNKRISLQSALGHLFEIVDVSGSEEILFQTNAGHKVSMIDVSGSEKILIQDKDGNQILMDTVNTQMVLKMAEILLGDGATEPAVLGNALKTLFNNHKHLGVATGSGVSGTPETEMSDSELSSTVKVKG